MSARHGRAVSGSGGRARLRVVRDLPTVPSTPDPAEELRPSQLRHPGVPPGHPWAQSPVRPAQPVARRMQSAARRKQPAVRRKQPAAPWAQPWAGPNQPGRVRRIPRREPAAWRRAAPPLSGALALALGGVLLLATGGYAGDPAQRAASRSSATATAPPGGVLQLRSPSSQPAPAGPPVAAPSSGPRALPIPTESADLADPLAGPVPDAFVQGLLDVAQTAAPPALPAATGNAAVRAAKRVLVADLTGTGRDRFPGFWSEPIRSAWSRIRVQGDTAHPAGSDPARVTVTLIWAGTSPTGDRVERRRTVIIMELAGNSWSPVSVS